MNCKQLVLTLDNALYRDSIWPVPGSPPGNSPGKPYKGPPCCPGKTARCMATTILRVRTSRYCTLPKIKIHQRFL